MVVGISFRLRSIRASFQFWSTLSAQKRPVGSFESFCPIQVLLVCLHSGIWLPEPMCGLPFSKPWDSLPGRQLALWMGTDPW